uniref:Uncharacterized protein n=1 Tax=viral metagenome TaxID=1070528 RepID=A0A6M3JTJ6_9ZZZZ
MGLFSISFSTTGDPTPKLTRTQLNSAIPHFIDVLQELREEVEYRDGDSYLRQRDNPNIYVYVSDRVTSGYSADNVETLFGSYGVSLRRLSEAVLAATIKKINSMVRLRNESRVGGFIDLRASSGQHEEVSLLDPTAPEFVAPQFVTLGGKSFIMALQPTEHPIEKMMRDSLEKYRRTMSSVIEGYKKATEEKIQEILSRAEFPIPLSKADALTHGVQCFVDYLGTHKAMGMSFPFAYRPQFINDRGLDLTEERQAQLFRDVRAIFWFDRSIGLRRVELLNPSGGHFVHYHDNCWGTFQFGTLRPEVVMLKGIVQRMEDILMVIDDGSLAKRRPEGLPEFAELTEWLYPEGQGPQRPPTCWNTEEDSSYTNEPWADELEEEIDDIEEEDVDEDTTEAEGAVIATGRIRREDREYAWFTDR